jgi:hypothetical protein
MIVGGGIGFYLQEKLMQGYRERQRQLVIDMIDAEEAEQQRRAADADDAGAAQSSSSSSSSSDDGDGTH